jgi:hypothetical protein
MSQGILPRDKNYVAAVGGESYDTPGLVLPLSIDEATGRLLVTSNSSGSTKATDSYGISAISETATYKYFFFEDASLNWYILRKTLATSVFNYTKGTGGYESVYVDSTSDPSGSLTFDTYGATF